MGESDGKFVLAAFRAICHSAGGSSWRRLSAHRDGSVWADKQLFWLKDSCNYSLSSWLRGIGRLSAHRDGSGWGWPTASILFFTLHFSCTMITPFLWFDHQLEEAMNFYVSIFPNSRIDYVQRHGDSVFTASFVLDGQQFMGLNGGPRFKFTEAISLFVNVTTQAEVDALWDQLTADGGAESRCGWLKDKYGLSWQIIPAALGRLLQDKDPVKAGRVMQAMLGMNKIIIADLEAAYAGGE